MMMTSNDDATQYLMIAEINKLLAFFGENSPETQFFIFTHNTHFYMQLKPVHPKEKKKHYSDFIRVTEEL